MSAAVVVANGCRKFSKEVEKKVVRVEWNRERKHSHTTIVTDRSVHNRDLN